MTLTLVNTRRKSGGAAVAKVKVTRTLKVKAHTGKFTGVRLQTHNCYVALVREPFLTHPYAALCCHGNMKLNASVSDVLLDCFMCARVEVSELLIHTKSQAILCFIKWESSVKLSGFDGGTVECVCVCADALSTFILHLKVLSLKGA